MRILIVTPVFPYPADSGGKLRVYNLILELSKRHDIFLICLSGSQPSAQFVSHLRKHCRSVEVKVNRRGVFRKAFDVLRSLCTKTPYIVYANSLASARRAITNSVAANQIDVVEISELCTASNVDFGSLEGKAILHAHNCEGPLAREIAEASEGLFLRAYRRLQARKMVRFEKNITEEVDAVISVTEEDKSFFQNLNENSVCAPNAVPRVFERQVDLINKNEILFVGTLVYPPNDEGVRWFIRNVFPELRRKRTDVNLKIIGRKPSAALQELVSSTEGVLLLSDVDDIKPHFRSAALMIAPLFCGGGSRLKILEAFSYGVPVVSTNVGASGLEIVDREHLLLADTVEDTLEAICGLLSDDSMSESLIENSQRLVSEHYLWSASAEVISELYNSEVVSKNSSEVGAKVLISIPHNTLLGPQGVRERLDGFLSLMSEREMHFLLPRTTPKSDYQSLPSESLHFFDEPRLFSMDIPFFLDFSSSFQRAIKRALRKSGAEFVVFLFPWGLHGFAKNSKLPKVYFSQGVEKEFASIVLRDRKINFFPFNALFPWLIGIIEKRACASAELVISMSERDSHLLKESNGICQDKVVALAQPVKIREHVKSKEEIRRSFGLPEEGDLVVFHGSVRHFPNRMAMKAISELIAPALQRTHPSAKLVVVGPGVEVLKKDNLIQLGFVERLDELLACCSAAVVPILEGSGVRMKILDYFSNGVPVVSTRKGIEGLEVVSGKEALIVEDSIEELIVKLSELLGERELQERLTLGAHDFLEHHHSQAALSSKLNRNWQSLLKAS